MYAEQGLSRNRNGSSFSPLHPAPRVLAELYPPCLTPSPLNARNLARLGGAGNRARHRLRGATDNDQPSVTTNASDERMETCISA